MIKLIVGKKGSGKTKKLMELVNEMYRYKELDDVNLGLLKDATEKLVLMLAPFIPHACEEMWEHLGHEDLVYRAQWPTYDESAMVQDTVEIVVQLNGKVKERESYGGDEQEHYK
mgnify:CR=1 FL=1